MFLPESLSKEVRYLVYGLIVFHMLMLLMYFWALRKSWNVSPEAQVKEQIKKAVEQKKIN